MNQSELEVILNETYLQLTEEMFSKEQLLKKLKDCSDENGKVSTEKLAISLFTENLDFTHAYLKTALSKVLCEK